MAKSIFPHDPKHPNAPKVFISYSHDSKIHNEWVRTLCDKLRLKGGANAMIDSYAIEEQNHWNQLMVDGFEKSDKVIIVLTRKYKSKANQINTGTGFEVLLGTNILRDPKKSFKLILIKKDKSDFIETTPLQFQNVNTIDFSIKDKYEENFKILVAKIWDNKKCLVPIGDAPFGANQASPIVKKRNKKQSNVGKYNSIVEMLHDCHVSEQQFCLDNLKEGTSVLWPVVPRTSLTIIHFAQLEIIEKLARKGCEVKVIIVNCGNDMSYLATLTSRFLQNLDTILKKREIPNVSITTLDTYYKVDFSGAQKILGLLIGLSNAMQFSQLESLNLKNGKFNKVSSDKIRERTVLKMINPILEGAACMYETIQNCNSEGTILVAGEDEKEQWAFVSLNNKEKYNLGCLFIGELIGSRSKNVFQEDLQLVNISKENLISKMGVGNFDWWITQYFLKLRQAPSKLDYSMFCKHDCSNHRQCEQCFFSTNQKKFSKVVDKDKIAEYIFERINPAQ